MAGVLTSYEREDVIKYSDNRAKQGELALTNPFKLPLLSESVAARVRTLSVLPTLTSLSSQRGLIIFACGYSRFMV